MKRIHINQSNIKNNQKNPEDLLPVITVKVGHQNFYGYRVEIEEGCTVVYRPDKPLSCGATVWIETDSDVALFDIEDKEILVC